MPHLAVVMCPCPLQKVSSMQPSSQCRTYATDVSDEEWKLLAPLFSGILSGFPLHLPVFISSCSPV